MFMLGILYAMYPVINLFLKILFVCIQTKKKK